jgi:hypothetical protein
MISDHASVVYRLRNGKVLLDTEGVIALLDGHGDRTYHWVLESGELSPVRLVAAAVVRMSWLAALAFLPTYVLLTYWAWKPAQVVIVAVVVAMLMVLTIGRAVIASTRARGVRATGVLGSVQRFEDWTCAQYLTVSAGLVAALMFAPPWLVRDEFENAGDGFFTPFPFLAFQVVRVLTLDAVEIVSWNWSTIEPDASLATGTTVCLNVLVGIGAARLLVQAAREASHRAETIVGDTFDVYRRLRHEPFRGGKWVVVHGLVTGTEERAIPGFDFVTAYEHALIPSPTPCEFGEPQM